jgi:hypothetical protein
MWRERVYAYNRDAGQFWLTSRSRFPVDTGHLEFEVNLAQDTFLTLEYIWLTMRYHNSSRIPFPNMPLMLGHNDVRLAISDTSGEMVGGNTMGAFRLGPFTESRLLPPGEVHTTPARLDDHVYQFDSSLWNSFTPPGHYTATLRWYYDMYGRPIFDGTSYLEDTVRYVVVQPTGEDLEACTSWRGLKRRGKKSAKDAEQLFNFYRQYQQTPYGPMALSRLIRLTSPNFMPYPDNTDRNWLKREMALIYPDYPTIGVVLRKFRHENTEREIRVLFEEICDSVPGTYAAQLAAKELARIRTANTARQDSSD